MAAAPTTHRTHVVVVGSGATGLTAALTASLRGLDVLVTEKASTYGGTSAISGGVMWLPRDAESAVTTYLQHHSGDRTEPEKITAFVETAPRMLAELGETGCLLVEPFPSFPDYQADTPGGSAGGRSVEPKVFAAAKLGREFERQRSGTALAPAGIVGTMAELHTLARVRSQPTELRKVWRVAPRTVWNKIARRRYVANGVSLVAQLRFGLLTRGIPLWLDTELVELLHVDGRVTGVRVRRDGELVDVVAAVGVILTAGGFERDASMRREYRLPVADVDATSGVDTNTGDAIKAGIAIGADVGHMDRAWWAPTFMPPGEPPRICIFERGKPGFVIVDARGNRYANEAQPYGTFVEAMLEAHRTTGAAIPSFMVFDQRYRSRYPFYRWLPGRTPQRYLDNGFITRADTLAELAQAMGIDPDGLEATVERFNQMALTGVDVDFARGDQSFDRYAGDSSVTPNPCLAPLAEPPFYAVRLHPGDLGTCGGLAVDEHARVIDRHGRPIPGLYAAGNTAASPLGGFYPGAGGTIGPNMTFGYIAACHAAAQVQPAPTPR
ncbi:MAG: FAD-dependent oxidoreductase [Ilumatobacteraceae bacterium]|nr:FAD-dependent oxidoreductase [Ilumatobacteraceae bacterium]